MDVEGIYHRAGYGMRSTGFGRRPAVVVVDLQNGFLDPANPLGRSPYILAAARHTAELLATARTHGVPIIYTVIAIRPDGADKGLWKIDLSPCIAGTPGAEVADVVRPDPADLVLTKRAPSAFFGTDLASHLIQRGIDTVLVAGCVTSGCVRATVVDAFSYGFRVVVPEECVGDQTQDQHQANLLDIQLRYADVLPLAEVLPHLEAAATDKPA
jgi:maleamate amidohydrolase